MVRTTAIAHHKQSKAIRSEEYDKTEHNPNAL